MVFKAVRGHCCLSGSVCVFPQGRQGKEVGTKTKVGDSCQI